MHCHSLSWLSAECVCSFGPIWANNSRVHCELFINGGHREREGALALLWQLQRRRGGQHPCQRGTTPKSWEPPALGRPQSSDFLFCLQVETGPCALVPTTMAFLENHGKNIQLSNQNLTAARVSSYNQGLLVTAQPLARQQLFQVAFKTVLTWPMTNNQFKWSRVVKRFSLIFSFRLTVWTHHGHRHSL